MNEDEKALRPSAPEPATREGGAEDLGSPGGTASGNSARSWERALEAIEAFLDQGKDKASPDIAPQARQVTGGK